MRQHNRDMNDNVKWIWFDLDDTLYDFSASSLVALHGIYERYGLGRYFESERQWVDIYHHHNAILWDKYNRAEITQQQLRYGRFYLPLRQAGVEECVIKDMSAGLDADYLDMLGRTGLLVDGAMDVVKALKERGCKIGILSNGFRGVQHQKLTSSGLKPYIDIMVLSDDVGVNKPDRRIFDHARELAGEPARSLLMVGDNPHTDIAGAVDAGWQAMLFSPHCEAAAMTVSDTEINVIHDLRRLLNW